MVLLRSSLSFGIVAFPLACEASSSRWKKMLVLQFAAGLEFQVLLLELEFQVIPFAAGLEFQVVVVGLEFLGSEFLGLEFLGLVWAAQ